MVEKNPPIPQEILKRFNVLRKKPGSRIIKPIPSKESLEEQGKLQLAILEKMGILEEVAKLSIIRRKERNQFFEKK